MGFPLESYRPLNQYWLKEKGLDPTKESDQSQQVFSEDKNKNLGSGTYDIGLRNPKADTVEFKDQKNIFASVDAGENDTVKLNGEGWEKTPDPANEQVNPGQKHEVYLNKKNNSAVVVNGGAKVELGDKKPDAKEPQPKPKEGDKPGEKLDIKEVLKKLTDTFKLFPFLGNKPQ